MIRRVCHLKKRNEGEIFFAGREQEMGEEDLGVFCLSIYSSLKKKEKSERGNNNNNDSNFGGTFRHDEMQSRTE